MNEMIFMFVILPYYVVEVKDMFVQYDLNNIVLTSSIQYLTYDDMSKHALPYAPSTPSPARTAEGGYIY